MGGGAAVTGVHEGVFLRAHFGFGYFRASASDDVDDIAISGAGPAMGLAAGFAVKPNLIIQGDLLYDVVFNPTLEVNGQSMDTEDASAAMVGVGAGVTYYMMPTNMYFSGTLAMTQVVLSDMDSSEGSEWGPGVALAAGKEWVVAPKTGIGVAARFAFGSQKVDPDFDVNWTTTTFSLLFSATYN